MSPCRLRYPASWLNDVAALLQKTVSLLVSDFSIVTVVEVDLDLTGHAQDGGQILYPVPRDPAHHGLILHVEDGPLAESALRYGTHHLSTVTEFLLLLLRLL